MLHITGCKSIAEQHRQSYHTIVRVRLICPLIYASRVYKVQGRINVLKSGQGPMQGQEGKEIYSTQAAKAEWMEARGRQGLKISTGSLLSGPNVQQAAPAPHLADLQFTAGSLLPMAIY